MIDYFYSIIMNPIKRSYINKLFTTLTGLVCFFLFAVQLNSQYFLPADPSADAKDPASIVARVVSSASLFGTEHLPVYKEEVKPNLFQAVIYRKFPTPDPGLVVSNRIIICLRGPPYA